ncbi:MAG: hypothetical protein IMZ64_10480 [Bacteroidetes bacterium]|nr:hypothetical protein [Bacteroidota bacterium]
MGNKLVGTTSVKLGIYETSTDTQLAGMVGDKKVFEDGRVFRLCKNGAVALAPGYLVQAAVQGSADDSINVAASASVGATEIVVDAVTSGTYAAHALAGGYLVACVTAGEIGTFYKIKDNTALVNATEATITLYDPLVVALVGDTSNVSICVSPYNGVVIDANSSPLVGVPLVVVAASTSTVPVFFWALCEGYGPAIATAVAITAGDYLEHSAGSVLLITTGDIEGLVAVAVTAFAASEAGIVKYVAMG